METPMYTEAKMFESFVRTIEVYLESHPEDRAQVENLLKWAHQQWGYEYQNHDHSKQSN